MKYLLDFHSYHVYISNINLEALAARLKFQLVYWVFPVGYQAGRLFLSTALDIEIYERGLGCPKLGSPTYLVKFLY